MVDVAAVPGDRWTANVEVGRMATVIFPRNEPIRCHQCGRPLAWQDDQGYRCVDRHESRIRVVSEPDERMEKMLRKDFGGGGER